MINKTAIIITLIICLPTLLMAIMKFIIQYAQIKADTEINKLANFIMSEVEGEPSRSQGAVDTAIRIIKSYQNQDRNIEK